MGTSNRTELVENALKMASDPRGEAAMDVLLHSDQGVQYAAVSYQKLLQELDFVCSMSRKGNCWDNAPMESFFHSLKTEWVVFEDYKTPAKT